MNFQLPIRGPACHRYRSQDKQISTCPSCRACTFKGTKSRQPGAVRSCAFHLFATADRLTSRGWCMVELTGQQCPVCGLASDEVPVDQLERVPNHLINICATRVVLSTCPALRCGTSNEGFEVLLRGRHQGSMVYWVWSCSTSQDFLAWLWVQNSSKFCIPKINNLSN